MFEKYEDLWAEFIHLISKNCTMKHHDEVDELIDEIRYQVLDWYDGNSYYAKPEDILVDYTFCTPAQAHKFLVLFTED